MFKFKYPTFHQKSESAVRRNLCHFFVKIQHFLSSMVYFALIQLSPAPQVNAQNQIFSRKTDFVTAIRDSPKTQIFTPCLRAGKMAQIYCPGLSTEKAIWAQFFTAFTSLSRNQNLHRNWFNLLNLVALIKNCPSKLEISRIPRGKAVESVV